MTVVWRSNLDTYVILRHSFMSNINFCDLNILIQSHPTDQFGFQSTVKFPLRENISIVHK